MKKSIKSVCMLLLAVVMLGCFAGCGGSAKEKIVIYTSAEDYRMDFIQEKMNEKFPDYDIVIEYISTSNCAAKLLAEEGSGECDIVWSIEYGYLQQLENAGLLVDLDGKHDFSVFLDDMLVSTYIAPELRNGGAIVVNKGLLQEKGLDYPTSYEDLLKPEYKGLISMPDPASSGTGYMFYLSLVNAMGETKALDYFKALSENVLQFTSSGSGPVNALVQGEAAIGLAMTAQAVTQINEGADFEILFFEEGSPYSTYGNAILKKNEDNAVVLDVFEYLSTECNMEMNRLYFPEQLYKDVVYEVENYPTNIKYADMSNDTLERKLDLIEKWNNTIINQ